MELENDVVGDLMLEYFIRYSSCLVLLCEVKVIQASPHIDSDHIYIVSSLCFDDEVFLWYINMRNIFHKCLFSTCLDTVCIQLCAGHCCAGRIGYIPIPMVTCFLFLCLVKFEVLLLQLLQVIFEQVFLICLIAS